MAQDLNDWPEAVPYVDAGFCWGNGKCYLFSGDQYLRYDVDTDVIDGDYPKFVDDQAWPEWPGAWSDGFDAAFRWDADKAYFFRGDEYLRYNLVDDMVDPDYPKLVDNESWPEWPGAWSGGFDAGLRWDADKAYFFRGDEYLRYNLVDDMVDPGYPKPVNDDSWPGWPSSWNGGIDAILSIDADRAIFFKDSEYLVYDLIDDRVVRGPVAFVGSSDRSARFAAQGVVDDRVADDSVVDDEEIRRQAEQQEADRVQQEIEATRLKNAQIQRQQEADAEAERIRLEEAEAERTRLAAEAEQLRQEEARIAAEEEARQRAVLDLRNHLLQAGGVAADVGPKRNEVETSSTPASKPAPRPTAEQQKQGTSSIFKCTKKTMSLEKNADEFVLFDPQAGIVYPGALIQGSTFSTGGSMTPITVPRGPGRVTLALATGGGSALSADISQMSYAEINQAASDLLYDFAETGALTPAKMSFTRHDVYSQEHLAVEVNANVAGANWDVAGSLGYSKDSEMNRVLVKLSQQYYTLVADRAFQPEEVFAEGTTVDDVRGQIGINNPAVLVSSVTYGRMFYLLFESKSSIEDLMAALSGSYTGAVSVDADAKLEMAKEMANVRVQCFGFGGSASGAAAACVGGGPGEAGMEAIREFITMDANFSPESPGLPISYKLVNLADNRQISLGSSTQYDVMQCDLVTLGCDGGEGSNAIMDDCGVCGGSNICKQPCSPKTVSETNEGAYIRIDLPSLSADAATGNSISFTDASVHHYIFPLCRRVYMSNMKFTCVETPTGGAWRQSGTLGTDANCFDTGEHNQPYLRIGTE